MIVFISSVILALLFLLYHAWQKFWGPGPKTLFSKDEEYLNHRDYLNALDIQHDVSATFTKLLNEDGAGDWPPKANHDEWPLPVRPYKEIYLIMSPLLATSDSSTDDESNRKRCLDFRSRMQVLLTAKIDINAVESVFGSAEAGDWDAFPRDSYNGLYSCISCLRHAYRWAINPVVKPVQDEKEVSLPFELDMPWSYFQRRFEITSPSGNIMSNVICNFDGNGQIVYLVNEGMPETVMNTEVAWGQLFYDSERMGIPVYYAMIRAILSFEKGDKLSALHYIEMAVSHLRKILQNIYAKVNNTHLVHSVWMRHIAGIHAWGATLKSDTVPIEYGGLSGSQMLLFLALDAFLGLDPYHSYDKMRMHVSINMRNLCAAIRRHSFRRNLSQSAEDTTIRKAFDRLVQQLRTFRCVHKVRAVRYLQVPAPERRPMTAALSILEPSSKNDGTEDLFKPVDDILTKRLNETI